MNSLRRCAFLAVAIGATPVHAHSPVPGIEGFYTGLLHPFSTPAQALFLVGLSLLAGVLTAASARWLLGGFLIASLAGLFLGPHFDDVDPVLFAMASVAGAMAALAPGKLVPVTVILAAVGGYLIGEISIPDDGPTNDRVITMSGAIVGANVGLLYLFGVNNVIRERYTWGWVGIAFRVLAAWLGAVALLMFALGYAAVPLAS